MSSGPRDGTTIKSVYEDYRSDRSRFNRERLVPRGQKNGQAKNVMATTSQIRPPDNSFRCKNVCVYVLLAQTTWGTFSNSSLLP